jgi:hypothetical protein
VFNFACFGDDFKFVDILSLWMPEGTGVCQTATSLPQHAMSQVIQ